MTRDFTRANGDVVTVTFDYRGGSPTTYSPLYGADGGDPDECEITKARVNGEEVELTDEERNAWEEEILADPPEYEPPDYDDY